MKKKIISLLLILAGVTIADSCTKLREDVLDESSTTGKTDKEIAEGIIAPVYARLPDIYRHTTYFALQEISTDEAILPYRGGTDWGDNGIYISLHRHETTSSDPNVATGALCQPGFSVRQRSRNATSRGQRGQSRPGLPDGVMITRCRNRRPRCRPGRAAAAGRVAGIAACDAARAVDAPAARRDLDRSCSAARRCRERCLPGGGARRRPWAAA